MTGEEIENPRNISAETLPQECKYPSLNKIILAASVGTLIEWYDFFIYGTLATVLASKFYRTGSPSGDLIVWLGTFAVGFIVRPLGAILFGYYGDLLGRKYAFLVTMIIMGLCTFLVGCLPTYDQIGEIAGYLLIFFRILQGLALGGEYGGAATFIAEHSPMHKRGYFTSFIQVTGIVGMLLSFVIVLIVKLPMGEEAFNSYGWRFPFLISILFVAISIYIRVELSESPLFQEQRISGKISKNPILDSFTKIRNLKYVAIALIAAIAQGFIDLTLGVVAHTGLFYALYFIQSILKVPTTTSYFICGIGLLLSAPLYVLVGWLSDKYGRKPFMLAGIASGLISWYPLYYLMYHARPYVSSTAASLEQNVNYSPVLLCLCYFMLNVCIALIYGPIAAFLVELFPTSIRYTSMSLPYHVGNGIFGGLIPIIGLSITKSTGNVFSGLWYPLGLGLFTFTLMWLFLPETSMVDISIIDEEKDEKVKA